jgi:hypothetical protein
MKRFRWWERRCGKVNILSLVISTIAVFQFALTTRAVTPCDPTPSGLVSWWRAESNAFDSIGGNNATFPNGMGFTTGEVGNAFNLDGVHQFVLVNPASPTNLDLGQGSGFTIECWIDPATTSPDMLIEEYERVLGTSNGSDIGVQFVVNGIPGIGPVPGALGANIVDTTGANHLFGSVANPVIAGVWQHIALSYDKASGIAILYRNGAMVTQANLGSFIPQTSFTNLLLGARTTFASVANPLSRFSGGMDEISFYNRALSQAEIQAIYLAGGTGKCSPPAPSCDPTPSGLVSWWPAESNAVDLIGGNNGTFPNGMGFTTGEVGNGFNFNGGNQYVLVNPASPANLDLGQYNGFTIEGWINPANTSPMVITEYERALGTSSGADVGLDYSINASGAGGFNANIKDIGQGDHPFNSALGLVTVGVWQHAALTYDKVSGIADFYLNGVIVTQANLGSFTPLTSFTNILLGGRTTFFNPNDVFAGGMDEISMYGRALSQAEIQAIYLAGGIGKCSAPTPPVITSQPMNQAVPIGGTTNFSVTASGTPQLRYQWTFNTTNIANATNDTLTLTNVQLNQAGTYAVVVSNQFNSVLSSNATLTVLTPAAITAQPTNQALYVGANASFNVTAIGSPLLSYQWKFNGTNIASATNATLVLSDIQTNQAGNYTVFVTNPVNSILSTNVLLTVKPTPMLGVAQSGNSLFIFWPVNASGFVLETSPSLSPANWVPAPNPPIQIGSEYLDLESIPMTATNQFLRLRFTGQ